MEALHVFLGLCLVVLAVGQNHHVPHPDHCMDATDCGTCNDGEVAVCNTHHMCECRMIVGRAVHEGTHCTQKSDCDGLTCAGMNGHDYDCVNMKCVCIDMSGVGKRAACHSNHDCSSSCPSGHGVCNSQNMCDCANDGSVGKRATCTQNSECDAGCPTGQTGVCNNQGHCECGHHGKKRAIHEGTHCAQKSDCAGLTCAGTNGHDYDCVNMKCACIDMSGAGKRAACHSNHDCVSNCPSGHGVCNSQNMCDCAEVGVGKRATCHSNHDCASSCPSGHGVCNSQNMCDCANDVGVGRRSLFRRAVHEGTHCTQKSDCDGLTCAGMNGHDYDCVNMKCACIDMSGGR